MKSIVFNQRSLKPSKVVCVGRNYAQHIAELNNVDTGDMVVFIKPNSALSTHLSSYHQEPLHYEGEIAFIVENGVFSGVGFGLDLTKRTLQGELKHKGLPWERAKAFNGSAVFDQFVGLPDAADVSLLSLELWIDGQLSQKGAVTEMLFTPEQILADLNTFITLEDGDIVMTGTPAGVGEVKAGAQFTGRILWADKLLMESCWVAEP